MVDLDGELKTELFRMADGVCVMRITHLPTGTQVECTILENEVVARKREALVEELACTIGQDQREIKSELPASPS